MGVTYKAFDTNLRCEVALKVIHPRYLADESSQARFLSEARAAAQLRHRNIASVFHLGSKRGDYFYAMTGPFFTTELVPSTSKDFSYETLFLKRFANVSFVRERTQRRKNL